MTLLSLLPHRYRLLTQDVLAYVGHRRRAYYDLARRAHPNPTRAVESVSFIDALRRVHEYRVPD